MDLEIKEKTEIEKIKEIVDKEREFLYGRGKNIENMTLAEIKRYVVILEETKMEYIKLLKAVKNTFSGV